MIIGWGIWLFLFALWIGFFWGAWTERGRDK
jgi:hypothetical protein